jgi:hypothetical protein
VIFVSCVESTTSLRGSYYEARCDRQAACQLVLIWKVISCYL